MIATALPNGKVQILDASGDPFFTAANPGSVAVYDSAGNVISSSQNPNTSDYELLINSPGHECTNNSTTTPLGGGGVFTGAAWQDMKDYGVLTVNIVTDQDSAVDGLDVQWSDDGVNVRDHDYMTIYANTPKTFTFGPAQRYYRIVYTNGGVAQTSFNLYSVIRRCYVKPSSHRITTPIVGEDDTELVKAVITGLAPDGTFKNVLVTNGGNQKISIEEFESGVSSNSNSQLNVTQFSSDGNEGMQLQNESGTAYGVKHIENKIRTSSMSYLYDIAEGNVPDHYPFLGRGYSPSIDTTLRTVWPYSATQAIYVYPTAEQQMEYLSTDNTQDIGTVIKGDATGNTVQADADGTTTSLEDDSVDFTAATAVAAGDVVILDPHGTVPEFGTVTAVAANTLTVAGGFSAGGTAASRYYAVIDISAHTGAQAIIIDYLDGDYAMHEEICVLNGTTVTTTVNTDLFRIQDMHVIAVGSSGGSVGAISLRNLADTPVYSYIAATFTTSRVGAFTVPAGQTVYLTQWMQGWATPNDSKVQTARFIMRANMLPGTTFHTGSLFYPWAELIITNAQTQIDFSCPLKFAERTDIEVLGIASTGGAGPASSLGRGWIE